MERIAIISDIHCNIVAFEAVLNDIHKRGIKRIFCAGDLALKGASPCEVVDLARKECEIIVTGNTDQAVCEPGESYHKNWHNKKLGEERIEFLRNLPMYYDFYMSGSLVRMFHASKNNTRFRVSDFAPAEEKMKLFEDENGVVPDIVLYGDMHIQYMQKMFNKTIINVGSVGNSIEFCNYDENVGNLDETLQAFYAIIEGNYNSKDRSSFSVQFVRVPYDIEKEIELAKKNDIPGLDDYIMELTTSKYRGKK